MKNNLIIQKIQDAIEKGEQISPFLFLGMNLNAINQELQWLISGLKELYNFPDSYVHRLENDEQSIKIAHTRELFQKVHMSLDYKIQIFVVENISRLWTGASNSLLKVLEEPWAGNVIFLTNNSQSAILDTLLSRVQIMQIEAIKKEQFTEYVEWLILNYVNGANTEILWYYFSKQFEKEDVVLFLYALIELNKKTWRFSSFLGDINRDLNGIQNNNFNAKFIIDSYLIKLWAHL